ncbi:ABC-F family ATP-binding cassette domain-containing protein [Bacillus sp. 31A1R]|uniref:ABC-F family ATP-binding cassette domain-containing protein n=1 Tax=Robertmurraya mangrovi TaxID=3098077 RepID=A0ABU5IXY3_9BACI|nr:ABC-F family ATP-binding cassette domain-containing protein [Bacillus sp. 31A1R]MDZ5472020.1 ABC-F family ATP-binding cassette domain-containing protein [Bacillus sp. 31A1R]
MSILSVQNLTHYYGAKLVLKNINFNLLNQERVGLVGTNGSGKSTLLQILNGTLLPDQGDIEWLPNVKVGYLDQHINLTEGITIRNYLRSAFQYLYDAELEMLEISNKMADCLGSELDKLLNRFSVLQGLLDHGDFYGIDLKVEEISAGLGIDVYGLETDVSQLSRGQRTKLLLAKLLLEEPHVLLLDEPTNYLDYEHIEWLQSYLKQYPHSFILISHDTHFMNEVVNIIYHLEHQNLTRYIGNYHKFMEAYEFRKHQTFLAYDRQQAEIKKLETYINKNKARASTSKQAKAREKKLLKIDRIETPSPPPKPKFSFKVCERPASLIVEVSQLEVGYDKVLLPPMSFALKRGEKVAIIGHNGIGKSTTLKTIMGELSPLGGTVSFGQNVSPSYFAQEWTSTSQETPLEYIWSLHERMTQKEVRQALARAGLKSEHIFQPLHSLSGGEQTRVRLCELMLEKSNWLILDEPTNHLDIQAKEILAKALQAYEGTVMVVSHEPEFYEQWVTQVWNMEDWRV